MNVYSRTNNPDMDVRSELCLEDFKAWSTMAVNMFLSLRKKTVTGSHETWSARWVNMILSLWEKIVDIHFSRARLNKLFIKTHASEMSPFLTAKEQ